VISTQHADSVNQGAIKEFVMEELIKKHIPAHYLDSKTKYYINPTGRFVTGGPMGDAGLTGEKLSWTLTVVTALTAVVHSLEKIHQKWIEVLRMRLATCQKPSGCWTCGEVFSSGRLCDRCC